MSFWSRISSSVGITTPKTSTEEPAAEGAVAVAEEASGQTAEIAESAEASRAARERLEYLFRYGTRQGVINPLLYVLTRYRAQEQQK